MEEGTEDRREREESAERSGVHVRPSTSATQVGRVPYE